MVPPAAAAVVVAEGVPASVAAVVGVAVVVASQEARVRVKLPAARGRRVVANEAARGVAVAVKGVEVVVAALSPPHWDEWLGSRRQPVSLRSGRGPLGRGRLHWQATLAVLLACRNKLQRLRLHALRR